jgi:hypothetical protein
MNNSGLHRRVAVAVLNNCTGCIVNRLGTIVTRRDNFIEVKFDTDHFTNWYIATSQAIIYLYP